MTKKTKHVTIRLTEEQFTKLADALITEKKNKSVFMRDALNDYLNGIYGNTDNRKQKNSKNQETL